MSPKKYAVWVRPNIHRAAWLLALVNEPETAKGQAREMAKQPMPKTATIYVTDYYDPREAIIFKITCQGSGIYEEESFEEESS